MNLCLIGPSGAGKGTHIAALTHRFGLVHLSTGNLLRENLETRTALGILAEKYMNQGELVPDEVVEAMIEEKLRKISSESGVVFDGFPRTAEQAKFLDTLLKEIHRKLDAAVSLRVSDDEIVKRLTGRLICRKCLVPFHKTNRPFDFCPSNDCKGEHLFQRADDSAATARNRLRVFQRAIGPVIQYYQQSGRLILLEAEGDATAVGENLIQAIAAVQAGRGIFSTAQELAEVHEIYEFVPLILIKAAIHPSLDIVLLGAPGCGKGTQAERLSKQFNLRHIAPGDLFLEHLKNETDLGVVAKAYMEQGELVPDDVTDAMISERLSQPDTSEGFILDGFPRNIQQAEAFKEMMANMRRKLAGAIYIRVPDDEIEERLTGRLVCHQCHTPYHLRFKPPSRSGLCDLCSGPLNHRDDDHPGPIRARLKTFHSQTEPLIDRFRKFNLLSEVDGVGTVEEVSKAVIESATRLSDPRQSSSSVFKPLGG